MDRFNINFDVLEVNMKKLTSILLAVLMLASLFVSCGGNDGTTTTEAPTTEAPTTEAPTTEAPTTEVPTTETPTTKPIGEYNISYVLNGGTNSTDNPSSYNTGDTITLSFPTKEDYMFMGWYTDYKFTNAVKEIADKTGDLTLYAKWVPVNHVIEFDLNYERNGYNVERIKNTAKTVIIPSSYKGLPVTVDTYNLCINADRTNNDVVEEIVFTSGISITKSVSFENATSLKRITVEEDNPYMKSIDGVLYSKDGKELICYPAAKEGKSYVIQNGTENVRASAFYSNKYIENIVVPDSVISIGQGVFNECTSLKDVELSKNIELIDNATFNNCTSLKKITIPGNVKTIKVMAFMNCSSLETVIIPNSVTAIESNAFTACSSLNSIEIPESVTTIDHSAFYDCPNLTIYCKVTSKPDGWNNSWSNGAKEVIWGYTAEE